LRLFIVVSLVFASPICDASKVDEKLEHARHLFFDCQTKNIQKIDNKQSDVKLVALALTNVCLDQYEALNKIIAQYDFDNSNERRMFTIDQNADYSKIDASLAIVNKNR